MAESPHCLLELENPRFGLAKGRGVRFGSGLGEFTGLGLGIRAAGFSVGFGGSDREPRR